MKEVRDLIPKRIIQLMKTSMELNIAGVQKNSYSRDYYLLKKEDDLGVKIVYNYDDNYQLDEFKIYLVDKKTNQTITVFHTTENFDEPIIWMYEGSWIDYTEKLVQELESKVKEALEKFNVKFRLPSVLK